jgi:3-hydroxyisobutyrate dehydrogenase-like beta-hydroxyacid dehydrogenase
VNSGDARPPIAVIGGGIMGSAIARNLVAAGLNVTVWAAVRLPLGSTGHRG